jgi:beta-phosphoglucomutase
MATLRACLFDLDGVIVDTAKHHFVAWRRLAEELSIPFTAEDNEGLKGLSRVDSLEVILAKGNLFLDAQTKLQLMEKKNAHYLELISTMNPDEVLPGVAVFIEDLQANGVLIGLGSSSKNAPQILELIGLKSAFHTIIDGNQITLSKPDPEVFLLGAQALGLDPSECLVFEDAVAGVEAARTGGFPVIGIGSPEVLGAADAVLSGFEGLTWHAIPGLLA